MANNLSHIHPPRTGPPPSGWGFGVRIRALAETAEAGRRARAAAERVWAAKSAVAPLPRPFFGGRRGWHDRLQTCSLVCWPAFLAASDQVRHQLPSGDPAGIGGQMDPVARPDARPVYGSQVLRWGLARTKEAK